MGLKQRPHLASICFYLFAIRYYFNSEVNNHMCGTYSLLIKFLGYRRSAAGVFALRDGHSQCDREKYT